MGGSDVIDARLAEEREAKQMLADLYEAGTEAPDFEQRLLLLRDAVLMHAKREERYEFPHLRNQLQHHRPTAGRRGPSRRGVRADQATPGRGVRESERRSRSGTGHRRPGTRRGAWLPAPGHRTGSVPHPLPGSRLPRSPCGAAADETARHRGRAGRRSVRDRRRYRGQTLVLAAALEHPKAAYR